MPTEEEKTTEQTPQVDYAAEINKLKQELAAVKKERDEANANILSATVDSTKKESFKDYLKNLIGE